MKPIRNSLLGGWLVVFLPVTASAFGFGMTNDDYYGPWGPYGPYGPYAGNPPANYPPPAFQPQHQPPYGPPPGARDVRGMWGSGPLMQWGSRDKEQKPKKVYKPYEKLREPWQWSRPWPSMLDKEGSPPPAESVSEPSETKSMGKSKPAPNYGATGQIYPGWQRYQDAGKR